MTEPLLTCPVDTDIIGVFSSDSSPALTDFSDSVNCGALDALDAETSCNFPLGFGGNVSS